MSSVHEINDQDELSALRLSWKSLLMRTRGGNFFQSLDWVEAYLRHHRGYAQPKVLVCEAAGETVGILPLVVHHGAETGRLTFPRGPWGAFHGPIGPNPTATLLVSLRHLAQTKRDWDLLDLLGIDCDTHDHGRTERALRQTGFRAEKTIERQVPRVEFSAGWSGYWCRQDPALRQEVDQAARRCETFGKLTLQRYRPDGLAHGDGTPGWDLYAACRDILPLGNPQADAWHAALHQKAAAAGMLDISALYADGHLLACAYGYVTDNRVTLTHLGVTQEAKAAGALDVLLARVLQDGARRLDAQYDLPLGDKTLFRWASQSVAAYRFQHQPTTRIRQRLLRALAALGID